MNKEGFISRYNNEVFCIHYFVHTVHAVYDRFNYPLKMFIKVM